MSIDTDWMICAKRGCDWQGTSADYNWKLESELPNGMRTSRGHCPDCDGVGFYIEKPLFIPLKAEFFEAFERGEKDTEYRLSGPRWNIRTCRIGRKVVLSCGYGKARRLSGVIVGFEIESDPTMKFRRWLELYPKSAAAAGVACIKIQLDPK